MNICNHIPPIVYDDTNSLGLNPTPPLPEYAVLRNLPYKTADLQTEYFDIVIPKGTKKIPLVIFFHGGGFFQGDKQHGFGVKYKPLIKKLLNANIAYATVNYRLLTPPNPSLGIKMPLFDCMAALQNIRFCADALRIKKEQIAVMGASAGAGASLWIGFNKDMKNTAASNFKKESTRVKAVVAYEAQSSYDMRVWANMVFQSVPFPLTCIKDIMEAERFREYYTYTGPLGTQLEIEQAIGQYMLNNPAYHPGMGNINLDMLSMMTKGSPPVWLESSNEAEEFPDLVCDAGNREQLVHHPYHPKALYYWAVNLNKSINPKLMYVVRLPELGIFEDNTTVGYKARKAGDFLIDNLQ